MKKSFKKYIVLFLIALGIILLFACVDYFAHQLKAEYSVPSRYFVNKIIYGTLIAFAALVFTQKLGAWRRALVFSLAVGVLLQIRYFIEGYALGFVLLFLVIHFVILFLISSVVFRFFRI